MDDIQQSQRAGAALEAARATDDPFAAAVRGTRMPIVITDARQADVPIIFANDAFLALTGYSREEVIGRNCRFLQGPETDAAEVARVREALRQGHEVSVELLNYRKDGTTFWNALFVSPVRDQAGEVRYLFGSQLDVTGRKEREMAEVRASTEELERALEEKTLLLHEVDHRVKNNLQLISSLMLLQSRRIEDENTRKALKGMLERVSAIATVHRRLFQSADLTRFDVAEFIRDLTGDLAGSAGRDDIRLRLDLEHVAVPASQAAPLALVVNELISNALKHAFPAGRPGSIAVSTHVADGQCRLVVEDDGVGVGGGQPPRGFGMTIVQLLAQQLRAQLAFEDSQPGLRVAVSIPLNTAPGA